MTNFCFSRLLKTLSDAGKTDLVWCWIVGLFFVYGIPIDRVCAQSSHKNASETASISKGSCDSMAVKPIRRVTEPYVKKPSKNSVDWTTMSSTYTHDAQGQRVDQFSTGIEPVAIERPDFVRSGFRHTRSTLQAGSSVDHYHSVEQWGPNVRPYGEWRYPTRPFSVPYPAWGPQLPQVLGGGFPWGAVPFGNGANMGLGSGTTMPGMPGMPGMPVQPGWQPGLGVGPNNALTPLQDDYYPPAPVYYPPTNGLEMQ
ncbi:MAG: hypothetical protein NTY42_24050 [Planctomycetota bacterium]|jgi:hypothetical protein|nr:hypothetical protein [Planctomycetota bacterium]